MYLWVCVVSSTTWHVCAFPKHANTSNRDLQLIFFVFTMEGDKCCCFFSVFFFSIYKVQNNMHDDTFLINMLESSSDFCVWHPESTCWFMCILLSRFTTGESISLGNVCVCIYRNIHCVGTSVWPNTNLSDWLNIFLLKFMFQMNVSLGSPRFACFQYFP